MARIRYIKPDFFKDEDIAQLDHKTRLFYIGLWGLADKAGRLEDRPLRLKVEIFPYENIDAEKCLSNLAQPKPTSKQPFIIRYEFDSKRYIQIVAWDKHQKPHHTEADSQIPPAPPYGDGKGNGDGECVERITELRNGEGTVLPPLPTKKRFSKPNIEDLKEYAKKMSYDRFDPQRFYDFYESKGWLVGKTPMKDWKAAVRNWMRNNFKGDKSAESIKEQHARVMEKMARGEI